MQKPLKRPALCKGCEYRYDDSGRFPVWRIVKVDADCVEHGYMRTTNVAALLRYGD